MLRCPMCGGNVIGTIPPPENFTGYFLSAVNENNNSIDPGTGFAVDLHGCNKCGTVFLHSSKLINSTVAHK